MLSCCLEIVDKLMGARDAWPFVVPVDPFKLDIPDYFDIVHEPMDLATILNHLHSRHYEHWTQVIDHVLLVFENAQKYNPPGNPVRELAERMLVSATRHVQRLLPRLLANPILKKDALQNLCQLSSPMKSNSLPLADIKPYSEQLEASVMSRVDALAPRKCAAASSSQSRGTRGRPRIQGRWSLESSSQDADQDIGEIGMTVGSGRVSLTGSHPAADSVTSLSREPLRSLPLLPYGFYLASNNPPQKFMTLPRGKFEQCAIEPLNVESAEAWNEQRMLWLQHWHQHVQAPGVQAGAVTTGDRGPRLEVFEGGEDRHGEHYHPYDTSCALKDDSDSDYNGSVQRSREHTTPMSKKKMGSRRCQLQQDESGEYGYEQHQCQTGQPENVYMHPPGQGLGDEDLHAQYNAGKVGTLGTALYLEENCSETEMNKIGHLRSDFIAFGTAGSSVEGTVVSTSSPQQHLLLPAQQQRMSSQQPIQQYYFIHPLHSSQLQGHHQGTMHMDGSSSTYHCVDNALMDLSLRLQQAESQLIAKNVEIENLKSRNEILQLEIDWLKGQRNVLQPSPPPLIHQLHPSHHQPHIIHHLQSAQSQDIGVGGTQQAQNLLLSGPCCSNHVAPAVATTMSG
ncbi:hypothetical protein CEUSTIGMA_g523.t1 [Chlamydomonas eustigma]|uniref:Bromo domain-containing protein n=1 Tax=Chlamydomonas eustigma TaxID=1157962 RepID=A0A250WR88_9CHLO|nr:hypothetical protein CEUSTIGMA_g523.t1 [Chlamydomonas eustigma]|eukprot:GAX73070.1 hypothetical protein CEUSTIGMA_g523.t1 [Chlamydomonas eustigma]